MPSLSPTPGPTLNCALGTYFEASACSPCPPGQFTNASAPPWPTQCSLCPAGKAAATSGSYECATCSSGKFSAPNRASCDSCDAGQFTRNNVECVACAAGKYAPTPQSGDCLACGEGSHTNNATGATTCTQCNAGFYSAGSVVDCSPCPLGTWSPSGQSQCTACEEGKYAAAEASSSCSECALGTDSAPGASECALAAGGYYPDPSGVGTAECPLNAVCRGNDEMPLPLEGFWVERRALKFAGNVFRCPRQTCTGASEEQPGGRRLTVGDSCWAKRSYSPGSNLTCNADELLCTTGAAGPLCGSCVEGYSYSSSTLTCIECNDAGFHAALVIGACLVLGALALALFAGRLKVPAWLSRSWPVQTLRQIDGGALRVCWATYQVAQSVSWNLDVSFPEPYPSLLRLLSMFSFDFIPMDCLASSNFYAKVALWATIPMALSLVNLAVLGCRRRCTAWDNDANTQSKKLQAMSRNHFNYWLLFSYLVLPPVMLKLLQALDCAEVADRRYLRIDTSIDCGTERFESFKRVNLLFIAAYAAVPALWFALLWQQRGRMVPWVGDEQKALHARNADESVAHLRFLFGEYRVGCYWWETLDISRRVVMIGVLPLLSSNTSRRAAIGMILALSSAALYRELEPFVRATTNVLAVSGQYAIFFTFGTALAIDVGVVKNSSSIILGAALLVVNLVVIGLALRNGTRRALERRQWRSSNPLSTVEFLVVEAAMGGRSVLNSGAEQGLELGSSIPQLHSDAAFNRVIKQHALQAKDIELVERVGAGAFGEVFFARCLGQKVAVKTLHHINEESVKGLRAEILLHASLRHPNIVNFVGGVWCRELLGLVIEWVPKGTLSNLLATEGLSWEESLLRLATDIARGMKYLHDREYFDERSGARRTCVVHRDLKSDNVLITDHTSAKIADFGASRAKGAASDILTTVAGTPVFAAPECMRGDAYDESVDVYSFGCVLMDMAVGESLVNFLKRKWVEDNPEEKKPNMGTMDGRRVVQDIWFKGWRPFASDPANGALPGAPPSIHRLIVQCCSQNPSERPTFQEILNELLGDIAAQIDGGTFPRPQATSASPLASGPGSAAAAAAAAPNPLMSSPEDETDDEEHDRRKSEHHIRMSRTYRSSNGGSIGPVRKGQRNSDETHIPPDQFEI